MALRILSSHYYPQIQCFRDGMHTRQTHRPTRKINQKTARAMLNWSHFTFRQRLLHKAREYPHVTVAVCTEEYTTRTCGASECGRVNPSFSGKVFKCAFCPFACDRDVNGARNIALKFLTESCT